MNEVKRFQRTTEDFTCEYCGHQVKGTGYTNHCPECLWCKHVDINPGDRQSVCKGLMEPISIEVRGDDYFILHRCERCKFERPNKTTKDDNMDTIIELSH